MSLISSSCTGGRATQQLTHLLSKTNAHRDAHTAAFTRAPREAYAALKPCALIQLVLIRCTSRTLSQPPQRLPCSSPHPGYVCPPICVSSNHSSPPPFILPFLHFHILLAKERTFLCSFFKNPLRTPLRPISASLKFFHILVPSLREPSPAGAHYRRAWSWLSGSPLICHIPVPTRCRAQQIEGVAE